MANSSDFSYVLPAVAADLEARLAEARESGASCLRECPVEAMELLLHPSRSGDVAAGVREHMDASLLKYSEEHAGVVMGYRGICVHGRRAPILGGLNPHVRLTLSCRLLLFAPTEGDKLRGTVNCVGADFVGLLVFGLFNVTVSDQHLQSFKYIKAKNLWKSKTDPKHRLRLGLDVQTQVVSVESSGPVLDIRAALDRPGTGTIAWLEKGGKD